MAKKQDSDKVIAQQAKENAALKAKIAAKEARVTRDLEEQVDWSNEILNVQRKYNDALDASKKAQKDIRDLSAEINEYIEYAHTNKGKITKEERKEVGLLVKNLKLQRDAAKEINKQFVNQQKIADIEKAALPHRRKLIESQRKLNKLEDKYRGSVEENLGFIDDIDNKIKEIPIVGGFLSKALGLDTIKEELTDKFTNRLSGALDKSSTSQKKAAEEAIKGYDSQIDRLNGVENAAGEVTDVVGDIGPELLGGAEGAAAVEGGLMSAIPAAGGLMAALGPILPIALAIAAAVMLFEKALEVDKEMSDMAKGMGMTKHEALEAHHQFAEIAEDTEIIGANLEALSAANKDLNAILGTNVTASKEMLEAQVLLTKQYGLSGEEAAAFQATSAGTGKTVEQNLATVEAMVEGYNTMTGDSMNFKEISKDIAKTSKATLASYKGDVKALTLAAVQAKKMGMSLEDTQQVADKLLDIESSIENEMKANVLTGKHMNMNAARQLALQGDSVGAAAEAVSQAGTLEDLNNMNIIQRKAIAEAAGVTVEQLMTAAELQKYSNALNGVQVKDMKDLTEEQIKQLNAAGAISKEKADQMVKDKQIASSQEKMAAMGDKLTAIFIKVAEPIVEMLDPLMELVDAIFPAIQLAIQIAFAPLKIAFDLIKDIVKYTTKAANFIGDLFGGSDKSETLAKSKTTEVHDAMINPSGGLEISGPKGKFKLDENDSVIAGTNLSGQRTSSAIEPVSSTSSVGNSINKEVVSLLKELIAKVDQPVKININGKVMDEIEKQTTLRKTYNTKVDSGYGTFG